MNVNLFTIFLVLCTLTVQANLDLSFSKTRGYHTTSFSLIIEADDPNATIRYTTNGRTPTFNVGSTYSNPISINTTKVVKAFAYSTLDTTKVKAHTYIFINDVLNQPDNISGFPYTTGFSTTIKNDGNYGSLLDDALLSIPVMCLSLHLTDYDFIYNNKGTSKRAYIEYFEPATNESYGRPTGVSTYGNTSFTADNANKKNYRLRFKDEFGADKFKYKIFGDEAASDFDVIDLRCGSQESFDREGIQNIHEQIMKDWQIKTSTYGVHGKFAHLYINGVYWGVYNASERPVKSFGESYFGGEKDDYNTMKATCCNTEALAIDGSNTSYNNMKLQINNYPAIEQYLDVDHFIDYVMICNYGPHGDWRTWNTYAFDNPTANVPYRFFVWDPEPSFKNDWYYTNQIVDTRDHEDIWQPLKNNADFRMRFADHVECNCVQADGPLNPNNASADYDAMFQQNKLAYLAEAARWANKNLYNEFLDYRDDIINTNWFFDRTNELITTYKNNNLYPDLDAVTFNEYGGAINNGATITLNNPNNSGSIRYTIDRSDPRASGGGLGSSAQTYNGNINLPNGVYEVKARIKQNSNWSAMCPRKFYVGQNYNGLVINEIHYNPEDSIFFNPAINAIDTVSGRNFEFIELKNTGTQDVYLEDVHFNKGVTLQFAENTIVQPGSFIVAAEDAFWFQQKYGFQPDATYIGKLENSGENIWLLDPFDNIIDTLKYDDVLPWDTIPDNGKYSLALINATTNNGIASNWSSQVVYNTPKAENIFCDGSLTFNETLVNISCTGSNDGFISGNAIGGNAPYTYQWDNGTNLNSLSNLSPGSYTLTLTDKFNCQYINSYPITQPSGFSTTISTTDQTYYQTDDGTANIIVSGGTPPYTYSWSNGATTTSINNLAPGNYSVDILDANFCATSESVTIQAIDCSTLTASISKTDQSYYQTNDGTANAVVSGGITPYNYTWSNNNTTASINNLTPGNYSVNILDAVGCPLSDSITIQAIDCSTLTASISKTDQGFYQTNDGTANASVTGGITPYSYTWSNNNTTASINNLPPGNYSVNILDAVGCPLSDSITIQAIDCSTLTASISKTDQSYYQTNDGTANAMVSGGITPYNYTWSNNNTTASINNLTPGNYSVNILDAVGCPLSDSITIQAIDCSTLTASISKTDQGFYQTNDGTANASVTGGITPYSYTWSNNNTTASINNLAPGNYSVNVLDAVGCPLTDSFTVNSLTCSALQVEVSTLHESCFSEADGILHITNIQGGTTPYSILWSTGITGTVINNLSGGNYQLNIADNQGCPFEETYTINSAAQLSANTVITNASSNSMADGSINLTATGGTPPYTYNWSNAASTKDISSLTTGNYWVSVVDANDCQLLINNLAVGNNCLASIVQQNHPALATNIYQVADFIQSNGMVNTNEQIAFKAGNYIELNNDFEVTQGADFEAVIDGCQ